MKDLHIYRNVSEVFAAIQKGQPHRCTSWGEPPGLCTRNIMQDKHNQAGKQVGMGSCGVIGLSTKCPTEVNHSALAERPGEQSAACVRSLELSS
jgi:hypothetical protein